MRLNRLDGDIGWCAPYKGYSPTARLYVGTMADPEDGKLKEYAWPLCEILIQYILARFRTWTACRARNDSQEHFGARKQGSER